MSKSPFYSFSPAPSKRSKSAVSGRSRRSLDSGFFDDEGVVNILPNSRAQRSEPSGEKTSPSLNLPDVPAVRSLTINTPRAEPLVTTRIPIEPPPSPTGTRLHRPSITNRLSPIPRRQYDISSTEEEDASADEENAGDYNVERAGAGTHQDAMDVAHGVWMPDDPKNITVHLDIDIYENLESDLEEFSQHVRLGRFRSAQEFFDQKLVDQMENPFVMVQYLGMLLSKGDFRAVRELKCTGPYVDELALLWVTIKECGNLRSRHRNEPVSLGSRHSAIQSIVLDRASSTTTIFRIGLYMSEIERDNGYRRFSMSVDDINRIYETWWGGRLNVSRSFVREGRIWDYHDMILEFHRQASIPDEALHKSQVPHIDFSRAWTNWFVHDYDQSTYLALLDIFATAVFTFSELHVESISAWKHLLAKGEQLTRRIAANDPESLRSRPYLHWILAKAVFSLYGPYEGIPAGLKRLDQYPGAILFQKAPQHTIFVPVYIPADSENPGWTTVNVSPAVLESVRIGLDLAKELEDHASEALCRKLLVHMSPLPLRELESLATFQRVVQEDMVGYLETTLSTYLFANSPGSMEILRKQLLDQDRFISEDFHPPLQAAREMVLRALTKPEDRWTERRNSAVPRWEVLPEVLYPYLVETLFATIPPPPREDIGSWLNKMEKEQPPASVLCSDPSLSTYWISNPTVQPGAVMLPGSHGNPSIFRPPDQTTGKHANFPGGGLSGERRNTGHATQTVHSSHSGPAREYAGRMLTYNYTASSASSSRAAVADESEEEAGRTNSNIAPVNSTVSAPPIHPNAHNMENRGQEGSPRPSSTRIRQNCPAEFSGRSLDNVKEVARSETPPAKSTRERALRERNKNDSDASDDSNLERIEQYHRTPVGVRVSSVPRTETPSKVVNGRLETNLEQSGGERSEPSTLLGPQSAHSLSTIAENENENRPAVGSGTDDSDASLEKSKEEMLKRKGILRKEKGKAAGHKRFDLHERLSIPLEEYSEDWDNGLEAKNKLRTTDGLNPFTPAFFKKERDEMLSKGHETDPEKARKTFMLQIRREQKEREQQAKEIQKEKEGTKQQKRGGVTFTPQVELVGGEGEEEEEERKEEEEEEEDNDGDDEEEEEEENEETCQSPGRHVHRVRASSSSRSGSTARAPLGVAGDLHPSIPERLVGEVEENDEEEAGVAKVEEEEEEELMEYNGNRSSPMPSKPGQEADKAVPAVSSRIRGSPLPPPPGLVAVVMVPSENAKDRGTSGSEDGSGDDEEEEVKVHVGVSVEVVEE